MDEEFNDVDVTPVDDVPEDDTSEIEDGPEDVPDDIPEDAPEEETEVAEEGDIAEDIPEDVPEEMPEEELEMAEEEDIAEDIPEDVPEDIPEEEPEMAEEEDIAEDIPEDVPEEMPEEEPEAAEEEDIAEDIPEDVPEEMPEEESEVVEEEDIAEDIPEDVPEEMPETETENAGESLADREESTTDDTTTDTSEKSALDRMSDYMNSHNYGPEDRDTYMSDPEWIRLNADLKEESGIQQSALDRMSDYMNSHNYGREDGAIYRKDPEWQALNEALKNEDAGVDDVNDNPMDDAASDVSDNPMDDAASDVSGNAMETTVDAANIDVNIGSTDNVANEDSDNVDDTVADNTADTVGEDDLAGDEQYDTYEIPPVTDDENNSLENERDEESQAQKSFDDIKDINDENIDDRVKLANDIMQNYDVGKADFTDFDPDVAAAVSDAIKDAKNDFPDLDVKYIGSIDTQVNGIKTELTDFYRRQLENIPNTGWSKGQIEQAAEINADNFITGAKLNDTDGTFAWSLDIPKTADPTGGGLSKYNGVAINKSYASDNVKFTAAKVREVVTQHKPIGCDTPRATVDHELGHEIDKLLGAAGDPEINGLYQKMMRDDRNSTGNNTDLSDDAKPARDVLSEYSKKTVKEFIAECYSEYRNNPQPREYSVKVYQRLKYLYGQRKVN